MATLSSSNTTIYVCVSKSFNLNPSTRCVKVETHTGRWVTTNVEQVWHRIEHISVRATIMFKSRSWCWAGMNYAVLRCASSFSLFSGVAHIIYFCISYFTFVNDIYTGTGQRFWLENGSCVSSNVRILHLQQMLIDVRNSQTDGLWNLSDWFCLINEISFTLCEIPVMTR